MTMNHATESSRAGWVFPLLRNADSYRACTVDLLVDAEARAYWLDLFDRHFDVQLDAARDAEIDARACRLARAAMSKEIELIRSEPRRHRRLDILVLDQVRQSILDRYSIIDEFRLIKQRENERALAALPERLAMLDRIRPSDRLESLILGMLAGNLFDMGVESTANVFAEASLDFSDAMARVPTRPYAYDELDDVTPYWDTCSGRKTVIFVDNAGGDIVLGVFPLARELVQRGAEVVLAANEQPVLNDITADELESLLSEAATIDEDLESPAITVVSTGTRSPLLDLTRVAKPLVDAAQGAGMIILIGMGRSIESNFDAQFNCPVLRVAMVKDPQVARTIDATLFDAVVRFDPGPF